MMVELEIFLFFILGSNMHEVMNSLYSFFLVGFEFVLFFLLLLFPASVKKDQ